MKKRFKRSRIAAPSILGDAPELTEEKAKLDRLLDEAEAAQEHLATFTEQGLRDAKEADQAAFLEAAQQGRPDPGREQERGYLADQERAKAGAAAAVQAAEQAREDFDQLVLDNAADLAASTSKSAAALRARAAKDGRKFAESLGACERAEHLARTLKSASEAGAVRGVPSVEFGTSGAYEPPPTSARAMLESLAARLERKPGAAVKPPQLRPTPKNAAKSAGVFGYRFEGDQ